MLLNGKAPLPGQIITFPNLAKTFRELLAKGKDGFYRGRVAQAIVDLIKSKGGKMELEDLASHSTSVVEPIKYIYANDLTLYEVRHPLDNNDYMVYRYLIIFYLVPSKRTR